MRLVQHVDITYSSFFIDLILENKQVIQNDRENVKEQAESCHDEYQMLVLND